MHPVQSELPGPSDLEARRWAGESCFARPSVRTLAAPRQLHTGCLQAVPAPGVPGWLPRQEERVAQRGVGAHAEGAGGAQRGCERKVGGGDGLSLGALPSVGAQVSSRKCSPRHGAVSASPSGGGGVGDVFVKV